MAACGPIQPINTLCLAHAQFQNTKKHTGKWHLFGPWKSVFILSLVLHGLLENIIENPWVKTNNIHDMLLHTYNYYSPFGFTPQHTASYSCLISCFYLVVVPMSLINYSQIILVMGYKSLIKKPTISIIFN